MPKGKKKGKLHNQKHTSKAVKVVSPGVTGFITRDRVAKKLQISADQFRQLCIYKGVHPVEPGFKKLRRLGPAKQWYYLKDVNFMNRDDIVQWFRGMHIYQGKKVHLKAVKKPLELQALKRNKPTLDMSHYILERYPSLQHALASLDDALSIIYLFAELEANSKIGKKMSKKHLQEIVRLKAEWQKYIIEAKALRKVFCSIKGVYYQAEVMGTSVTWLVPHTGQQIGIPSGVDVLTMSFFAQFYIALLSFVFYKLYTNLGYHYPPKLESTLVNLDETVKAVQLEKILPVTKKEVSVPKPKKKEDLTAAERERIAIVNKSLNNIINIDDQENVAKQEEQFVEVKQEPTDEIPEEFIKANEEAGEDETKIEYAHDTSILFRGLVFFINREIPKIELQFMIRACGGEDITDYTGNEFDTRITHHIVDREWDRTKMNVVREYIQPQWVFDSINSGILLPYHEYAPDAVLPAHLSPFVNDKAKGYIPAQREHLDDLIAQRKGEDGNPAIKPLKDVKDEEGEGEDDKMIGEADAEEAGVMNAWEAQYVKELAAEQEGKSYAGYAQDEQGLSEMLGSDVDEDDIERQQAKARKAATEQKKATEQAQLERMSMDLLNVKQRKIVRHLKTTADRIARKNEKLVKRRLMVDKRKKEEELKKHQALPAPAPVLGGETEGKRKATDEQPGKKAKKAKKEKKEKH